MVFITERKILYYQYFNKQQSYIIMREELDLHKFAWDNCDAKKYKRGGNKDKDGKFRICIPVYMAL